MKYEARFLVAWGDNEAEEPERIDTFEHDVEFDANTVDDAMGILSAIAEDVSQGSVFCDPHADFTIDPYVEDVSLVYMRDETGYEYRADVRA